MLSEKILLLQQNPRTKKTCLFADVAGAMKESDRTALVDALISGSVSMRALERLLTEEGTPIGRDSLTKARHCAIDNKFCKCGFFTEASK